MEANKDRTKEETEIACKACGDSCALDDVKYNSEHVAYCIDCYDDKYFECNDCGEEEDIDNASSYNDDYICQNCRDNHYYRCNGCNDLRHETESCCDSEDEDNHSGVLRPYSDSSKYTVQNKRDYACEIECYFPEYNILEKVSDDIPKEIGITEDGSLRSNGIEFNTPRLSGKRGEKLLKDFTETLVENNFRVDSSCGLHIHLDGKDILSTRNALQKLMIFFMVYEDVIMSFLPLSRRDNTYCRSITEFYHLAEIKDCYELESFEKIWYREESKHERDKRKQDRHDHSRYAGINFHSLIANGHLEIRYHSGTINYEKIINWINLFVGIMDQVQKSCMPRHSTQSSLMTHNLLKARFILGLPEKTLSFFNAIALPQEQRQYFLDRQKKFVGSAEENSPENSNETPPCAE